MAPVVGLWAITGSLLAYAVFGSSRQLSVGPESTTALMTATAIAPLAGGDPARYAVLAAALALVVGGICVLGWVARLGVLADLLSRPVLVGYMAGIAVIMIVGQLGKRRSRCQRRAPIGTRRTWPPSAEPTCESTGTADAVLVSTYQAPPQHRTRRQGPKSQPVRVPRHCPTRTGGPSVGK